MTMDTERDQEEELDALREMAEKPFPLDIMLDSTGDRRQLKPIRAYPWLKCLLIIASFPLTILVTLLFHFNVGTIAAVVFVIAVLWFFAELRSKKPAPLDIELTLTGNGGLWIEAESGSVWADHVGPVWEQDGLIFALVHGYDDFEECLDNGWVTLLHLDKRTRKLGQDSWQASDLKDEDRVLWPGTESDSKEGDALLRTLYSNLLENPQHDTPLSVILLGRPFNRDEPGYQEEYDRLLGMFNVLALCNLAENVYQAEGAGQESEAR